MSRPVFTQTQVDEIVTRAVASATPPAAAAAAAVSDTALALDAVKADRERIGAINALPEAKGREGLAMTLATATDMTVGQAKAALAAAPTATAGERAGDREAGLLWERVQGATSRTGTPEIAADSWDDVLARKGLAARPGA